MTEQTAAKKAVASAVQLASGVLQRACACGTHGSGSHCAACVENERKLQRHAGASREPSEVPPIVHKVLRSPGQPLDAETRAFFEPRFGRDLSRVRIHSNGSAAHSAHSVGALAYTVGRDVVFAAGQYQPRSASGRRLLAHELVHVVQQGNNTARPPDNLGRADDPDEGEAVRVADEVMQQPAHLPGQSSSSLKAPLRVSDCALHSVLRRPAADDTYNESSGRGEVATPPLEEGVEINPDELMLAPRWKPIETPVRVQPTPLSDGLPPLQRQAASGAVSHCDTPSGMRKVTSGSFEGGKTLDDYFPDLVGTRYWGSNNTAGPFDNGYRAGSAVQLIGDLPIPCATSAAPTTLTQTVKIIRLRGNGLRIMEGGRPLEGRTLDDIRRSGRDQSRAPFRQTWVGAVTMADPISGAPYSAFSTYEFKADLTSSLTGAGGAALVRWGVTVESSAGRVTKNEVR